MNNYSNRDIFKLLLLILVGMTNRKKQISDYLFQQRGEISDQLQSLGHPDRFAIVVLLYPSQQTFLYLQNQLKISKTTLANHLQYLVSEKLITKVERGLYRIVNHTIDFVEMLAEYQVEKRKRELQRLQRSHLQSFESYQEVQVMKINTNKLTKEIKFQPAWITYAGAISGVLQGFGENYDVNDVLAYSGYAFLSNISRKSTHIAAPTATPFFEQFDEGTSSLGYPLKGFWDEGAIFGRQNLSSQDVERLNKLFNFIKDQLDLNNPVILWGLGAAEFGIVTGYEDESLIVSTFREHVPTMADTPIHYTQLDAPGGLWAYYFDRKEAEPNETTDRQAIERALYVTKGEQGTTTVGTPNEEWGLEEMDYIAGPKAFGIWATNIEHGNLDQRGNAYVLACYHEGRAAATSFFEQLSKKYTDRGFSTNLSALHIHYGEITEKLEQLHKSFPFPDGNTDSNVLKQSAEILRELMHLEFKSIELLEECLDQWKKS